MTHRNRRVVAVEVSGRGSEAPAACAMRRILPLPAVLWRVADYEKPLASKLFSNSLLARSRRYLTTTSFAFDAMPFATTTRLDGPVSTVDGNVTCVVTTFGFAIAIELWLAVRP